MKKQFVITTIAVLLVTFLGLSGCQEETSTGKLVTASVNTLALTLDDLPEDFKEIGNNSGIFMGGPIDAPNESYSIHFVGNYPDERAEVRFEIYKFNSSELAIANYNTLINLIIQGSNLELIDDSVNKIGDESKALSDNIITFFYFRISNIVCIINVDIPGNGYTLASNLAKKVEQKIYNSIS